MTDDNVSRRETRVSDSRELDVSAAQISARIVTDAGRLRTGDAPAGTGDMVVSHDPDSGDTFVMIAFDGEGELPRPGVSIDLTAEQARAWCEALATVADRATAEAERDD